MNNRLIDRLEERINQSDSNLVNEVIPMIQMLQDDVKTIKDRLDRIDRRLMKLEGKL